MIVFQHDSWHSCSLTRARYWFWWRYWSDFIPVLLPPETLLLRSAAPAGRFHPGGVQRMIVQEGVWRSTTRPHILLLKYQILLFSWSKIGISPNNLETDSFTKVPSRLWASLWNWEINFCKMMTSATWNALNLMVFGEVLRLQLRRTFFHLDTMWRAEAFSWPGEWTWHDVTHFTPRSNFLRARRQNGDVDCHKEGASDVSGQDFGRWLTTWSHQAKPPQSLLGARTKSSRYWFVVPVVSFCCTLLNLQPPWPASTETLIQTYLIWTVTSMNFNVSLIWKLGENMCVAPWICWTDAFTGFRWHLLTSLHCHLLGFGLDLLSPKEDSFALHETVLPRLALPAFLVNREWLWQDQACLYAKTLDPCALSQIGVVSDEALL